MEVWSPHAGLSVVVPVLDEAGNVLPLAREIRDAMAGVAPCEILFVDDGSRDATPEELLAARREIGPAFRILRHREPCGQSASLYDGARSSSYAWLVTLDGDGQNDPADIPLLLDFAARSPRPVHLVMGQRRSRRDTWLRRLSSRVANGVRQRLLGDNTPDTGCGLKLMSRESFLRLPYFDHYHRFLPALFERQGDAVGHVEVSHRPRRQGSSKYGVWNRVWVGLVDLVGVMWLQRRARRTTLTEVTIDTARNQAAPGPAEVKGKLAIE